MSKTTTGYNSLLNQSIKGKLIEREIYACISDMAKYLFSYDDEYSYGTWDEWDNTYVLKCPECGETVIGFDESENEDGDTCYICPECKAEFECEPDDTEPQEIYEYWLVSSWLGEKLRDLGEPVFERYGAWIWGRCCTGQAILLDWVISKICENMGILEGQEHEWKP